MKSFKRIVGLLLCLAMVLSFLPASVVSVAKAATTTTTDVLEKINLSGTAAGGCSTNGADVSSIDDLIWYHETTGHESWNKYAAAVDGSASSVSSFSCSSNERADWYLDLSNTTEGYTAVDQFILYAGGTTSVPTTKVVFQLEDGTEWEQTFTTSWSSADDTLTYTFDETINATGMYVWQTSNTTACLGEIELYQYVELPYLETATLNGVDISEYQIVYSASDLDYAKTAAEYIQEQIMLKTGRQLDVVTDSAAETTYEIQVGNVDRTYAESISAPNETAMKFTFASNGTKIAMKADYFIIAGAAYYFVETYIGDTDFSVTANTGATIQNTITKKAKNYIFMIGDGMGEMHTRLFEIYDVPTSGDYAYSDGEDIFYGYYLPYFGWQKTANIGGTITDSAAAGTALSCGYKTINGYVGKDQYLNDIKSMSELAMEFNKSVAVMSTEGCDGATPAAYSAHSEGRYDSDVEESQKSFEGLLIDGYNNYNQFTASEYEEWEACVRAGLSAVKDDPDGFFIMYEEAHIDKVSHRLNYTSSAGYTGDTSRETLFRTVYRFNQAIGLFMEYALYNPDTMLLITADHETAGLDENWEPTEQNPVNEQQGGSVWNHSLKDVPVFSYGAGAEIFDGVTAENASYARTWADLMTEGNADDFGNPAYPIIGSGESGEEDEGQNFYTEIPANATKVTVEEPTVGYYEGNTNGSITPYYDPEGEGDTPGKLIDGIYTEKGNRLVSGYYTYEELADGTKIPVILFEFDEDVNVAGIKLTGYEFGRYNIEDFDIEVYAHDGYSTSWYTAATVRDAFTSGGTGQITEPLEIGFNKIRTATKMRIIVKGITNMSAEAGDDAESAELATGSYFRIKEIEVYETEAPTVTPQPTQPTEPETQPTEAPTTPAVNPDDPNEQGTVLEIVPATKITPQFGVYTDANLTVFEGGSDAYCLTDGWFGRHADSQKKTTDGTIAAILTLDKATTLGGIEIVGRIDAGNDMTSFRVQVKTANGWETVVTATSNPFDSGNRTVKYEFATPVATDEVRIIVDSCESTECKIGEIVLYEATTGKAYELIDLTGKGSSTDANAGNPIDNLGDTDKTTTFLGSNATFDLTVDGQPTAVDGFNLFAYRGDRTHPTSVQVFVQQDEGGEYVEIGTFDTGWSNTYPLDSLTVTFDQTYYAYNIRFVFDGWDYVNGLELYGYVPDEGGEDPTDPTDPTEPTEPTEPDVLPNVVLEPVTNAPTPIVGYYTDKNTNGNITEYLNVDTDKGKVPAVLVDGETGSNADYNWTGYYRYDDVASGAKIPAYLFEFDEPVAFTGVEIDTYKAMYYAMEDFTVQVYIEGKGWVTATTVADSFGAQTQEEYADPITYAFAEPLYGTKIRILVDKLWDMYDWRYDDENSFNLEYEASIRLREITLMEDPDYVPPEDAANTLMPPSSLDTEFTDTTITAVAPPSTEYPEAEIRYAVYLNGALVEANSTGIFTGLQPNTRYTIYAKYIGDGDEWLDSHPISNTTATDKLKLPTPNVEVALGTNTITATADEIEGGELQFRLLDANHVAIGEWQSSGNFTGLTPNTTYYIQARYNGDTNHYDSEVRTLEVETGKILLPKPTLTVSGTTHNTITLNALPAVTGGAAEYSYRVAGGEWIVASGNVITGLTPNTTYELRARYVATDDSYNTSLYSEVVSATTMKAPLPAPNVSVGNITDSGFTVTADTNENGTLMFRIDGGEWQESGIFTGLDRNTAYTVEAMYVGKNGYADSDVATTTATTLKTQLTNPTGLKEVTKTATSITVTADTTIGGTLKFSIDGGNTWQTETTFTGLTHGTNYTVWAKYFADEDYIDSAVTTIPVKTLTILDAPALTATTVTTNSITVTADTITGGTLMFRLAGGEWQTSGTFTGLTHGTTYTVEAMYVADEDYINSATNTIQVKTLTILAAPDLTATSTETTITASAPAVTGGTLQYRINGGAWQTSPTFTGLDWNTTYTISAMYVASEGYVDSGITTISIATTRPADPTAGDYADLEAIPESGITPHVGYNRYSNHEAMVSENTTQAELINDGMYDTVAKIQGVDAVPADQLADGYKLLTIIYDLNAGATKIGAVELTGGNFNLTKFAIQVKNTEGKWQTVKFVTNDLFDISDALRNDTVLLTFTPVTGTRVRLLIDGYEANSNNAPEIREMVVYEAKDDAQLEEKTPTSGTAAVMDNNKANAFTGTTATLTFAEPTSVKRLKLFGSTVENSIGAYTVKVQTSQGGEWTQVATGTAFSGVSGENTCIVNLDQEYKVYGVQVIADKSVTIPEIEVYGYKGTFVPVAPDLPDVTPTDAPTRPAAVSPVQTTPVATEEFVVPDEPDWTETTPGNEGAWNDTKPGNESAWSDPTPVVPDETGTEPTAPTAPATTQAPVVMGWLDAIPASEITAYSGDYDASLTTFTDRGDNEAGYLNNSAVNTGGYIGTSGKSSSKVQAAVFDLNGTKMIGAVELIGKHNVYLTSFDVQYKDGSGWHTAESVTSNLFETDYMTVRITFDPVEATEVRILVYGWVNGAAENTGYPMLQEITWYEVKIGNALQQITVNSVTTDAPAVAGQTGNTVDNIIDGDKGCNNGVYCYPLYYSSAAKGNFDFDVAKDGQPVSLSRMKIYAMHTSTYNPSSIVVYVQTTKGGSWTQIHTGTAYASGFKDTFVLDFNQTYSVYGIRLEVKSVLSEVLILTEVEFYGPGDGYIQVSGTGTTTVGSAGYVEIPLSSSNLKGACSDLYAARDVSTSTNFSSLVWYFKSSNKFERITGLVDGNTSPTSNAAGGYAEWNCDPDEGADIYLDLGSSGTAIDQIRLYSYKYDSAYANPSTVKVFLVQKSGGTVEKTFTTGWSSSTANGTVCKLDLGQTYTVTGVYILSTNNTPAYADFAGKFSLAEIELYAKKDVQLDAPANLQATEVGTNSITVAANTLNPAAAGTLMFRINGGAWQTSGTFSGLTAGTSYTIDAMYDAADGYIDSGVSTITVTTATPIITEFTVSGTVTAGATVQLYKDRAVVSTVVATNGSYEFTNVNIGNYTLVVTKAGHTAQMMQITVDKDLTVETITLVSAYAVSGTTTAGATVTLYQGGAVKQTATADGSGNYSFGSVALGNYTLVFTKTGYYTQTASITVSDANVTKSVTLTQTGISGTVDAGATVELYQNGAVVATDVADDGSYSFSGVALGKYTLVFSLTGYHTQTAIITLSTEDVTMNVTLVSALYTVSGTTTAGATVTLYQNGEVYKTTTADGSGNYSFSDVLIGNYALTFTKAGYIAQGTTITVSGNLNVAAVALQPVPVNSANVVVDAVANTSYNVRLYEPWALRVNVTFYTEKNGAPINLSNFKSYGAYAIIAHKFGDGTTAPTSWEEIISDPDAVQFKMAANEGDGNMFPTSGTTATFDHYDGLYTYRLAESVYWVAYYEDAEGTIHFTSVNKPVLMDKVDNIIEKISGDEEQDTQRIVLEHMKQLYRALRAFRGEDAELGNNPYDAGTYLGNVDMGAVNNGTYQFGKTHKIRLIEPWSVKVTYQVRDKSTKTMLDLASATDYGVIIYHDKTGEYYGNMTAAQMLERKDAVVYSKEQGNITLEDGKMVAVYDKDIFTYEMDSEIYILPFVEVDGQYHYGTNASRIYLIDEMYAYYNNTTLSSKERATFRAMIELFESTIVHRKKFGK